MNKFKRKKNSNMVHTIIFGILIALVVSLAGCGLIAGVMVNNAQLSDRSQYIIAALQFISVLSGALISSLHYGRKYILASLSVGVVYFVILVSVTVLAFDSSFSKVITGLLMCALAAITAGGLSLVCNNKRKHKIRK